jgi:GTP-binding protein
MSRTVAIVGRPNVGKSALFNRLAGRKIAIVHDRPGVTRDRIPAECTLGSAPFTIFDTGGIGADVDADFTTQVRAEVDIAVATSEALLFVVDGQDGLTLLDADLAKQLRRVKKPIVLVVNKIDHAKHGSLANEFSKLGFDRVVTTSAEHNHGIKTLVETVEELLPPPEENVPTPPRALRVAIVGRPNVGKSSLMNAILGDERTLVSPIPGTTRDAVDIEYQRGDRHYVLIDTAGIRPRGKVNDSIEVFSVMRSENSIERADLCCLVIDATAGVTSQDKKIAGLIQEARRPCIIAVNKWDLIKERTGDKDSLNEVLEEIRAELFFLSYAPVLLVSAKTGASLTRLFKSIEAVERGAQQRLGTGPLNRLIAEAFAQQPAALRSGKRFKILYATIPVPKGDSPMPSPQFVFFCNNGKLLDDHYRRYLEARIREQAPYPGLPLIFHFRSREERGARK